METMSFEEIGQKIRNNINNEAELKKLADTLCPVKFEPGKIYHNGLYPCLFTGEKFIFFDGSFYNFPLNKQNECWVKGDEATDDIIQSSVFITHYGSLYGFYQTAQIALLGIDYEDFRKFVEGLAEMEKAAKIKVFRAWCIMIGRALAKKVGENK